MKTMLHYKSIEAFEKAQGNIEEAGRKSGIADLGGFYDAETMGRIIDHWNMLEARADAARIAARDGAGWTGYPTSSCRIGGDDDE